MRHTKHFSQPSRARSAEAVKGFRRLFLFLPLIMVVLLATSTATRAQTDIKGWTFGAESSNHVDVSYSVVKCTPTSNAEVHLQIFNEKATADVAKFDVVIADAALGQSFTTTVTRNMALAELVTAECAVSGNLKITVPAAYDPAAITVTITFIP